MRTITFALLFGIFGGCVVSTQRFYLPTDSQYAETGTVCGSVPWGRAKVGLADSVSMVIDLRPIDGRVGLSVQIALPRGASVRFSEPVFRLQNSSTGAEHTASLERFRMGIYGRDGEQGRVEYIDPGDTLEGKGRNADLATPDMQYLKRDLFMSTAVFDTAPVPAYVLRVPAIEVNGVRRSAQAIPVALVEKTGVTSCVQ